MKNNSTLIFFICLFIFSLSSSAQNIDAQQAYDSSQHLRSIAMKKWGGDRATKSDIAEGIRILHNSLDFLQNDYISELGNGNIYLEARKKDVYVDIAKAYAIEGENDSAICYLEKMFNDGSYSWSLSFYLSDSALKNLQSDPRFIALANKFKNQGKLYSGTAFKTPYQLVLTDDEKIEGLSLLWSQAKYNFVYFDRLNIDQKPVGFDLPGGGSARVCAKRETYPDGKKFVGIGIAPDIIINPTIEDLQNGKDSVKDKALELLNSSH